MDNTEKKYAVDEIIDDIVILENLDTKERIEENREILPENIHDGSILVYENYVYKLDYNTEMNRRKSLRERIERLKALKKEEIEEDENSKEDE